VLIGRIKWFDRLSTPVSRMSGADRGEARFDDRNNIRMKE
jgi:hypothetical protein